MDPALLARVLFEMKNLEKEKKKEERERKRAEVEDFDPDAKGDHHQGDGRFRLETRSVFLTYAHSDDVEPEDVLACLEEKFPDQIKDYDICQEPHKDGSNHLHAFVNFKGKIRTRDKSAFDLYKVPGTNEYLYHAHIQSTKNKEAVRAYIYKGHGGKPPKVITSKGFDWSKTGNYKKRKEDYLQYRRDLLLARQKEKIPSFRAYGWDAVLTFGQKQRHFWFFGEFSTGKSTEVYKNNFKEKVLNYKVRAPQGDSYWGCFDNYSQERFIIFDDTESKLSKGLICSLSALEDSEIGETPVGCRYKDTIFYKEIIMIVLSNSVPGYHYQEDWRDDGWFKARFTCIEVGKNSEGRGEIVKVDGFDQ